MGKNEEQMPQKCLGETSNPDLSSQRTRGWRWHDLYTYNIAVHPALILDYCLDHLLNSLYPWSVHEVDLSQPMNRWGNLSPETLGDLLQSRQLVATLASKPGYDYNSTPLLIDYPDFFSPEWDLKNELALAWENKQRRLFKQELAAAVKSRLDSASDSRTKSGRGLGGREGLSWAGVRPEGFYKALPGSLVFILRAPMSHQKVCIRGVAESNLSSKMVPLATEEANEVRKVLKAVRSIWQGWDLNEASRVPKTLAQPKNKCLLTLGASCLTLVLALQLGWLLWESRPRQHQPDSLRTSEKLETHKNGKSPSPLGYLCSFSTAHSYHYPFCFSS